MNKPIFIPADILIPKTDHEKWSVVACDQYTSEREYWAETERMAKGACSALDIILPEVYLEDGDTEKRIEKINRNMSSYIESGIFKEYKSSMIAVRRSLSNGKVRYGIVGAVDLEAYDYNAGSSSYIRATEGTVLSRIPPRVKIRKDAPLELPHIMILINDPDDTFIVKEGEGETVYDFELMQNGGHLKGTLLSERQMEELTEKIMQKASSGEHPLVFAVGDGNHSLATAKACCDENVPLSGYALCEIVNIHDASLEFEPIYRVVFGVSPEELTAYAKQYFSGCSEHKVECIYSGGKAEFYVDGLTVGKLQDMLDEFIKDKDGASVDYIHGEGSVKKLCENENTVGFLFDGIGKNELFEYVENHGALPRKTFSMGEANDKRYYMECRKIK